MQNLLQDFNFDAWRRLAESSPQDFEKFRLKAVERLIVRPGNNAMRLRRLQWRIEVERRRAVTPLKSCLRLSCLMWESFDDFQDSLNRFVDEIEMKSPDSAPTAKVIPFPSGK